jgi:hypothetical protein
MGDRHKMDSIGESYEVLAESILNRFATLTRIGTKQDFGTDMYCQPRIESGPLTETVTELCMLQVKGGTAKLQYGGCDDHGTWKVREIEWLKSLWAPIYLAHVDEEYREVNIYSLWPIWWVLWQSPAPFKIKFLARQATTTPHECVHPISKPSPAGEGHGDGQTWTIDLGAPMLQLTHQHLNEDLFRTQAIEIFRYWIRVDRQIVARFHTGISFIEAVFGWVTNQMPGVRLEWLMMNSTPGVNIELLARALTPAVLGLGAHLQHQDNCEAFRLIPILEWLEVNHFGNLLTGGLLEKLSRAKNEGVSPRKHL